MLVAASVAAEILAGLSLVVMTAFVLLAMLFRPLGIRFFYASEYTGFLLAWLIFFTLPAVSRARQHIRVTFLVDLLRPRMRNAFGAFSDIFTLVYCGGLLALCAQITLVSWTDHIRSQGILLTWLFYPQLGMVLGLALMWLMQLFVTFAGLLRPNVAEHEAEMASAEVPISAD
jgi:TRAP-type C4-dicarboxylate transport system permease small subunit